jgi:hypothetical protein
MQQRTRTHLRHIHRGYECVNAYQGELLGLMAIHLTLLSVNKLNSQLSGSVEIVSDCLGALKRVTFLPSHRIPLQCHHSNILKTILVHCCGLSFTTYYSHIKAHQDDNALFDKLSRKAQLNCICDHVAKAAISNQWHGRYCTGRTVSAGVGWCFHRDQEDDVGHRGGYTILGP